ncbi:MAG: F0F1 ATP synthase subunit A [Planctomycetota bacterium]
MIPLLAEINGDKVVGHVSNHPFFVTDGGFWVWSAIMTNLILSGLIMLLLGPWIAKHVGTGPESDGARRFTTRNPFAHMIEVICTYLREEIVRPILHERTEKFMPFLWTLFFFILINNMLGLVPLLDMNHLLIQSMKKDHIAIIGGTATQNIAVTGVLAVIAMTVVNIAGIRELGFRGYLEHNCGGIPIKADLQTVLFLPIIAIVFVIEILGNLAIKPIALAVRLFANMTAGHILLATCFAATGAFWTAGSTGGVIGLVIGTIGGFLVYMLEIFVGFIQAFIFFFLTTVFISLLAHHDEEHAHDEAHADDHGTENLPGAPVPA